MGETFPEELLYDIVDAYNTLLDFEGGHLQEAHSPAVFITNGIYNGGKSCQNLRGIRSP